MQKEQESMSQSGISEENRKKAKNGQACEEKPKGGKNARISCDFFLLLLFGGGGGRGERREEGRGKRKVVESEGLRAEGK